MKLFGLLRCRHPHGFVRVGSLRFLPDGALIVYESCPVETCGKTRRAP